MRINSSILTCLLVALLMFSGMPARAQYDNFFFRLKPSSQKGPLLYKAGAYEKAIPHLKRAISNQHQPESEFGLMLAHAYALTGNSKEAIRLYRQAGDPQQLEARHLLAYTLSLQAMGRTQEAYSSFQVYLTQIGENTDVPADLGESDLYRAAIRYTVRPLSINSPHHEFAPLITSRGLLFVSDRRTRTMVNRKFSSHPTDLDVFEAQQRSNTRFVNTRGVGSAINSGLHEGPGALDSAGALYFSRSERNGLMSLWKADALDEKGSWKKAERLEIPAAGSMFHPAVSADGNQLFFVSDMPGGAGGTDIYYSTYKDGSWSAPENAGPKINTRGNEAFPVLQANRLYFSSDGRIGLGRMDIYEAYLNGNTTLHVRNMGAPVNSPEDDFGLVWLRDGTGGYFSSSRKGGRGGDDLYRLDYHIITLEGTVLDSTNHRPMDGVKVDLLNPDGSTRSAVTTKSGAYTFTLFPGEKYLISAEAKSYRPRSQVFSTMQGKQYGKRQFAMALERKTRIFVLGNVRLPERKRAAHARVVVYDMSGGKPDTLQANERGSFELELDTDATYNFLFSCDEYGSIAEFKTDSRTDASLSHYLNADLKKMNTYRVEGRIEGANPDQPLVVWLTNSLNGETTLLWPDQQRFSFPAISLAAYELCVQQGEKTKVLYLGNGWQQPLREVVLKLK